MTTENNSLARAVAAYESASAEYNYLRRKFDAEVSPVLEDLKQKRDAIAVKIETQTKARQEAAARFDALYGEAMFDESDAEVSAALDVKVRAETILTTLQAAAQRVGAALHEKTLYFSPFVHAVNRAGELVSSTYYAKKRQQILSEHGAALRVLFSMCKYEAPKMKVFDEKTGSVVIRYLPDDMQRAYTLPQLQEREFMKYVGGLMTREEEELREALFADRPDIKSVNIEGVANDTISGAHMHTLSFKDPEKFKVLRSGEEFVKNAYAEIDAQETGTIQGVENA